MKVQSIILLKELAQKKSDIVLPETLLAKHIELSNPEAFDHDNFFIQFDSDKQLLELRYMEHDPYYDNYWLEQDIGELIDGRFTDLYEKIESLKEDHQPYFLIATYEHGSVMHYPVYLHSDITTCKWDTGIKSIFVPNESFIQDCNNNSSEMMSRLKAYFEEYSDWCNGYVYTLCRDFYNTATPENILFISDCDATGGYIGYENAAECLSSEF